MSPTQVQLIYVLQPLCKVMVGGAATRMASSIGRVQTCLFFKFFGIVSLYAMVFFESYLDAHPWKLVTVYIFRSSFMSATYPVEESLMMDYVRRDERARWKSLESIAGFGWCGSAAIGGLLSDRFDYSFTFFITATTQGLGSLFFFFLLSLVPPKEQDVPKPNRTHPDKQDQ